MSCFSFKYGFIMFASQRHNLSLYEGDEVFTILDICSEISQFIFYKFDKINFHHEVMNFIYFYISVICVYIIELVIRYSWFKIRWLWWTKPLSSKKSDVSSTFIENIFRSGLTLVSSNDIITVKINKKIVQWGVFRPFKELNINSF